MRDDKTGIRYNDNTISARTKLPCSQLEPTKNVRSDNLTIRQAIFSTELGQNLIMCI